MRPFTRRHKPSPESETAKRAAEKSLQEAQARMPETQARLNKSRRVKEQLRAHNRANAYSDFIEGIVLGRLSGES
jgi:F0F1-type ATP synthase assembly protein I